MEKLLIGVGTLERRWKHCEGKGKIGPQSVRSYTELRFERCVQDRWYELHLATLVEPHTPAEFDVEPFSLRLLCFDHPLRSLFWLENFQFWGKVYWSEYRLRNSSRMPLLAGGQNVEIDAI